MGVSQDEIFKGLNGRDWRNWVVLIRIFCFEGVSCKGMGLHIDGHG